MQAGAAFPSLFLSALLKRQRIASSSRSYKETPTGRLRSHRPSMFMQSNARTVVEGEKCPVVRVGNGPPAW